MRWFVIPVEGAEFEYVSLRRLRYLAHRSHAFGGEMRGRQVTYYPARGRKPALGFFVYDAANGGGEWRAA